MKVLEGTSASSLNSRQRQSDGRRTYTLIDLFCGAGGFTLGFTRSKRFRPVFANDFNHWAVQTYNRNLGEHCQEGDINAILKRRGSLPEADVVIGGPPCQGFSLLNKQKAHDPRKQLWRAFMKVVLKVRPKCFVMENVPELLKSAEFEKICRTADRLGYGIVASVLNAADYGVPQRRRRAFVIGSRSTELQLPVPTHCSPEHRKNLFNAERKNWSTVRDAIGDLPDPVGTEARVGRVSPPMDLHFGRNPTEMSLARYRCVPEGGNREDLQRKRPDLTPTCWIDKRGGTDLFGRLWWSRPSFTIRTEFFKPEKGRYLHPSKHRPITHREAARLMTFPDRFLFCGSKIEIARQIGNAVPPTLAERVAGTVAEMLDGVRRPAAEPAEVV